MKHPQLLKITFNRLKKITLSTTEITGNIIQTFSSSILQHASDTMPNDKLLKRQISKIRIEKQNLTKCPYSFGEPKEFTYTLKREKVLFNINEHCENHSLMYPNVENLKYLSESTGWLVYETFKTCPPPNICYLWPVLLVQVSLRGCCHKCYITEAIEIIKNPSVT